ncbi:AraC family transcriptional regulator [Neolewinella aurantiaca]|uniref:AraC family transcriptional regulator n=1 Tax=Neolewinella aurantiaca TaxID=2602767 RepID=A0A5C7FRV9_9BACT|nr:helix-turn-helix domain-containing protein [Neolewinella aurantiaca]TXF89123.1 AraC family transcriptional regulator [Neolewinella aurantiaca]
MISLALLSIAIFQGIVVGLILLSPPLFRSNANRYLAFAIFSLSLSLLNLLLDDAQAFERYPFLGVIDVVDSALLFPVLVLLFVVAKVGHPLQKSRKPKWLFIPVLFLILTSAFDEYATRLHPTDPIVSIVSNVAGLVAFLITLVLIPFILVKTHRIIQHAASKQVRRWLTCLWIFEIIFLGSWLLAILLSPFIESGLTNAMQVLALFSTLLIHWIAYSGVFRLKLANDREKIRVLLSYHKPATAAPPAPSVPLLKKSSNAVQNLTVPPQENKYFQTLSNLCLEHKIHRDSSLDRASVAKMLDISPGYVSQIVNAATDDNFATYINRHRVEDVKKLILDDDFANYSLLAIGLECGFSSKSTYYNSFKKITGVTPNAYRKAHRG